MLRFSASVVFGFVLLYFQSCLVMKVNGYTAIEFLSIFHLAVVWTINFFLVFSILSQIKPWLIRNKVIEMPAASDEN